MRHKIFNGLSRRDHPKALPAAFLLYVCLVVLKVYTYFFLIELSEVPIHLPVFVLSVAHVEQEVFPQRLFFLFFLSLFKQLKALEDHRDSDFILWLLTVAGS